MFALNVCATSQELAQYLGLPQNRENEFADFREIKNYLTPDNGLQPLGAISMDSAAFFTNYSRNNLLQVLPPTTSFRDLVKSLIQNHRVAIGWDDALEDYITQSDIVKFLKEKDALCELASKTIKDLGLGTSHVISINQNQRAVEAFKKMVINKVSGIAVVDDNSHLVGQISSSDIKCISQTGELVSHLYDTYSHYKEILINKYNAPDKTITVPPLATFGDVVDTLVKYKLHRVFVVGEDNALISVISLTDVLKVFLHGQ